tara:strand:- start:149 stop:583 length:435 start_codon:yes stop_codon:yes gene_type:complete
VTDHFSLQELTRTAVNATNLPNQEQKEALQLLAEKVLEPAREILERPIRVTSGFRSVVTNRLIPGSSKNSQHCKGEAADLQCHNNLELFNIIKDYLVFDQLIYEHTGPTGPAWVHVSYKKEGNRGQILQAISMGGRTQYVPYKL